MVYNENLDKGEIMVILRAFGRHVRRWPGTYAFVCAALVYSAWATFRAEDNS